MRNFAYSTRAALLMVQAPAVKPVSTMFNAAVFAMCDARNPIGFRVVDADRAPDSYRTLVAYVENHGVIAVSNEASEKTIYADNECNYAFRAWHDACHLALGADFTIEGEIETMKLQQADIVSRYGLNALSSFWCRLLDAEVRGQAEYYRAHGRFPDDQRAFVMAWLDNAPQALKGEF